MACGPGGVGLVAAELVGPEGAVVLTDVAAEMTAIAARRATALGQGQVEVRAADAEALAEPDPFRALLVLNELQLETVELAPSGPNVDRARVWLAQVLEVLRVGSVP